MPRQGSHTNVIRAVWTQKLVAAPDQRWDRGSRRDCRGFGTRVLRCKFVARWDFGVDYPSLVWRYLPVLRFDEREDFWNASSYTMTEHWGNELKRNELGFDSLLFGAGSWNWQTLVRKGEWYPGGGDKGTAQDADYIDPSGDDNQVADDWKRSIQDNWTYERIMRGSDGRIWIQYWLFYYKNSLGLGPFVHQGDWEMVQYGLDFNLRPLRATYSRHSGEQERCTWDQVKTETEPYEGGGTRQAPVVFVAAGSHANYFLDRVSGFDFANGTGERRVPKPSPISTTEPKWVAWPGKWGADPGSSQGPSGGGGPKRTDPLAYHQLAEDCTNRDGTPR